MNLASTLFLLYVLTYHFWSFVCAWSSSQHLSLLWCLKHQIFYSRLSQVQLNENQGSILGTGPGLILSSFWFEKIKRYIPLLHFIFHLHFTLSTDTQGELFLSSAKATTSGGEHEWHYRSHTWKMKQWEKEGFLIIPLRMLLPPEFVKCEFLLISISIRNEKFVTKDICSANAKLPALH